MQIIIRYILAFIIIFGILGIIFSDEKVKQQLAKLSNSVIEQVQTADLYPNQSCEEPISYRLGNIDNRFGISEKDIVSLLKEAEDLWETAGAKDLFVYNQNDTNAVPINFIFDQRQADIIAANQSEEFLNTEWNSFETLASQYESVSKEYKTKTNIYDSDVAEYEALLSEFNDTVDEWNENGGSKKEYQDLKDQEFFIKTVFKGLEIERERLNETADRLNNLAEQVNAIQSQLNRKIGLHNERFAEEEIINSGDFDYYKINIYQYYSIADLRLTLAHEMGHAIGIDHVEDKNAIMYYLLESQDVVGLEPQVADIEALFDVCG